MRFLKRAWRVITVSDTALSLAERVVWVIGLSTVSGLTSAIIAWAFANPYAALVIGLATWIAVAILLLVIIAKRTKPRTSLEPADATPQPAPTDEQLTKDLKESEREREKLQAQNEALGQKLAYRGGAGEMWGAKITQEDTAVVNARLLEENAWLKAEIARLREQSS